MSTFNWMKETPIHNLSVAKVTVPVDDYEANLYHLARRPHFWEIGYPGTGEIAENTEECYYLLLVNSLDVILQRNDQADLPAMGQIEMGFWKPEAGTVINYETQGVVGTFAYESLWRHSLWGPDPGSAKQRTYHAEGKPLMVIPLWNQKTGSLPQGDEFYIWTNSANVGDNLYYELHLQYRFVGITNDVYDDLLSHAS